MADKMEYPELGTPDVQMAMLEMHDAFEEFPPDAHLICPMISQDDEADYTCPDVPEDGITAEEKHKRIADACERRRITYGLSLLLVMPEQAGKWIKEWKDRVNSFLTNCDKCARTWHRTRQQFMRAIDQCVLLRTQLHPPYRPADQANPFLQIHFS